MKAVVEVSDPTKCTVFEGHPPFVLVNTPTLPIKTFQFSELQRKRKSGENMMTIQGWSPVQMQVYQTH